MSTAIARDLPTDPAPARTPEPEPGERLRRALEHASHYLPAQAPLEVFVHHNTLHAFQHLPFHEAVAQAQSRLKVRGYMSKEFYREALDSRRIREEDLDAVLADEGLSSEPIAPGFPSEAAAVRLVVRHGVGAETLAHLRWILVERDAANRFGADVPAESRARIVRETSTWLDGQIDTRGPGGARDIAGLIVSPTPGMRSLDPLIKLGVLLGQRTDPRNLRAAFDADPELVAVRGLWTACIRACEHLEGKPVPGAAPLVFHRDLLLAVTGDDPSELVHGMLIPLCGSFLDRGQSHWTMPDREKGFFRAWVAVMTSGRGVRPAWLAPLDDRLRGWLARDIGAEEVVFELLAELGVGDDEQAAFVEHILLQLPGWAGMFARLEHAPGPIGRSRALVRLVDFLAVRLTLDVFAYRDLAARLGHRGPPREIRALCAGLPRIAEAPRRGRHDTAWPLFRLCQLAGVSLAGVRALAREDAEAVLRFLDRLDENTRVRLLHEAYERRYRVELLDGLAANLAAAEPAAAAAPRAQVMFCIDDRFESSRRHLEEFAPDLETYGVAGFFGLAIAYQGIDDPSTFPLCPVVVSPQHKIEEQALTRQFSVAELRAKRRHQLGQLETAFSRASRSLILGPLVTAVSGFFAAIPLLANVFMPRAAGRVRQAIEHWWLPEPLTRLTLLRAEEAGDKTEELMSGFTLDEMATRVASLLENIGLVRSFARLVVVLGHDSSSVNNPYFPAYSCGACGGRSGGPNARLFARMANHPGVRDRLARRGIAIGDDVVFVGGLYDTAADAIRLYDVHQVPESHRSALVEVSDALEEMCRRNAHERCRRFASAPADSSPERSHRHVEGRALDLAQARPELGHATNAGCFVGRRALSKGLFLDRRVFLVSYDPAVDPSGAVLERILLAAGPVGAGINLEYFFSSVDAERLGAGTKLPHNVTGLFGVMNGASSDLRTGLPRQMTEVHEPVRLHLVVEASPATLLAIAGRQPIIAELVTKEWVRLIAVDPDTREIFTFDARFGFRPYHPTKPTLPTVPTSRDWYAGLPSFLPPALIRRPTA